MRTARRRRRRRPSASCWPRSTPAQLALAWLLHKTRHIIPIPGTTRVDHLHEDLAAAGVRLPAGLVQRLEALINQNTVSGNRYGEQSNREVDAEVF